LRKGAEPSEVRDRISTSRNSIGITLFNSGNYFTAIENFSEAIINNGQMAKYYLNRAKCFALINMIPQAVKDYVKAHELDPTDIEAASIVAGLKS